MPYRDSAAAGGSSATATGQVPAGAQTGDFQLAFIIATASATTISTVPTGWTLVRQGNPSGFRCWLYTNTYTSGDDTTPSWDLSGSTGWTVDIWTGSGYTGIDVENAATNTGANSLAVAVTPTVNDVTLVVHGGADTGVGGEGRTWTVSGTPNERIDQNNSTAYRVVSDETLSGGSGVSASRTVTITGGTTPLHAFSVALAPAAAGTAPAGHASGTGQARTATTIVSPAAPRATGTGTAHQPTIIAVPTTTAPAGHASGTGAAHQPVGAATLNRAPAGHAAGTGQARTATATGDIVLGAAFLVDQLDGARLIVEVSWGADLLADPDTWDWTDITADVRQNPGIVTRHGASNEASTTQPATCRLVLDNRAGDYSFGPQAANYPYVRRGTPVRVQVDLGAGVDPETVFQGDADGWTPAWAGGPDQEATVTLSASGVLRRILQGVSPVVSALRRALLARTDLVAYWPCEDGRNATTISSGLEGLPGMTITGEPQLASDDSLACSSPLPVMNNAQFLGTVESYTATGDIEVRFVAVFPTGGLEDQEVICRVFTTGTAAIWDVYATAAGALGVRAWSSSWVELDAQSVAFDVNGDSVQISLQLEQSGSDVIWTLRTLEPGAANGLFYDDTLSGRTIGIARQIEMCPNINIPDLTLGHIQVRTTATSQFTEYEDLAAFDGEAPEDRIERLCDENNLHVEILDTGSDTSVHAMGPQRPGKLLDLLREAEAVGQGILTDGLGAGLTYITNRRRENQAAALTLDAAAGQLARDVGAEDDDSATCNRATATRTDGGAYTYEDTDGPLGAEVVGLYDTSLEVNVDTDDALRDYASWAVHLGTVEGYRYPRVAVALHHDPDLADDWLGVELGGRVDVTNLDDVRPQHPAGTVSLAVVGYQQRLSRFVWDVDVNAAPYQPWRVGEAATDSGDTGTELLRPESDGSTLAAGAAAGATSLSVATPSGPLWTTVADDLPLTIEVEGTPITVTAISGASSPQTFTVTGSTVVRALTNGAAVQLHQPTVPGI